MNLDSGREADARVARAMGCEVRRDQDDLAETDIWREKTDEGWDILPGYTTDLTAAWRVVDSDPGTPGGDHGRAWGPLDLAVAGILKEIRPYLSPPLRKLPDDRLLALVNWNIIAAWNRAMREADERMSGNRSAGPR